MLWEIDIHPAPGQPDRAAERVASGARDLGFGPDLQVVAARGYLVQGATTGPIGHREACDGNC